MTKETIEGVSTMKKEEVLDLMKNQMVLLRDKGVEIMTDERQRKDFVAKVEALKKGVKCLKNEDLDWLRSNYSTWFDGFWKGCPGKENKKASNKGGVSLLDFPNIFS